jgi:hypothetical protein
MNELLVLGELHKYLNGLGPMVCTLPAKSLSLGYRPNSFGRPYKRFATLNGDKKYQCLILHVDPGNPESVKGKIVQKEIQEILKFNLNEMRNFQSKNHEVYVPFEIIDSKEKMKELKAFINTHYEIFLDRG